VDFGEFADGSEAKTKTHQPLMHAIDRNARL
jgi:hypothetical protein